VKNKWQYKAVLWFLISFPLYALTTTILSFVLNTHGLSEALTLVFLSYLIVVFLSCAGSFYTIKEQRIKASFITLVCHLVTIVLFILALKISELLLLNIH